MPNKNAIDTHKEKASIIEDLLNDDLPMTTIASKWNIARTTLIRYKRDRLPKALAKAVIHRAVAKNELKEIKKAEASIPALNQLQNIMALMYKQLSACDEYLSDPEDPSKYNLDPRAWECDVVYLDVDPDTGRSTRKRESMQRIIDQMNERNINPVEIKMNQEDPRKLILSTATVLTKQLELIAKIEGIIQDTTVNVTVNQQWQQIEQVIYEATENHPEVRKKIVERLAG